MKRANALQGSSTARYWHVCLFVCVRACVFPVELRDTLAATWQPAKLGLTAVGPPTVQNESVFTLWRSCRSPHSVLLSLVLLTVRHVVSSRNPAHPHPSLSQLLRHTVLHIPPPFICLSASLSNSHLVFWRVGLIKRNFMNPPISCVASLKEVPKGKC